MKKDVPQRTCLGCRHSCDKGDLLRFVRSPDGQVIPDLKSKLPGRGAYTCLNRTCIRLACERNQFTRAFKQPVTDTDPESLCKRVELVLENSIASFVSLANKAGKVASGSDLVADLLKKKQSGARLVLIATDISKDIGNKVRYLAELTGAYHAVLFTKDRLGDLLGKGPRSVLLIQNAGFTAILNKEIYRYRNFFKGEGCAE